MRTRPIPLFENAPLDRAELGERRCRELQRLDEAWADTRGETIFDWSRRATIRAKSWVGVIQVPGLSIEILPKIEALSEATARRNLLYMLATAGDLPLRERDLASLASERTTLLDALILSFSERLLEELRLGLDHAYLLRDDNTAFVRGKLLLHEQLRRNMGRKDRVFVSFDEFIADTPLNRIFKCACRVLLPRTRSHVAERNLRLALAAFDDVQDVAIRRHHFTQVHLTRSSDRFEAPLEFCRIVLSDGAPSLRAGTHSTFSLLFPMERVFERFVARAMLRHASHLGLDAGSIAVQARGAHRWLVSDGARDLYRLCPDLLVRGDPGPKLLVDTKWKRLASDESKKQGASQADMYQMVAYATRYDCSDNVLVFPGASGVSPKRYVLPVEPKPRTIRVELIDLSRDLLTDREGLIASLRRVAGTDAAPVEGPALATTIG